MGFLRGQGATEYLVLLAIVLIIALVSVVLLGFFPGMASDSQRAQSEMYWKGASPIAITEWAARLYPTNGQIQPYYRVKNNGAYPIRISGIIGGDGIKATSCFGLGCGANTSWYNISDLFYLSPGEEKYFGPVGSQWYGLPCDRTVYAITGASTGAYVGGARSICENSTTSPGTLIYPSLGFEYIEYFDSNQQITRRQIGKQVIIKCLPAQ